MTTMQGIILSLAAMVVGVNHGTHILRVQYHLLAQSDTMNAACVLVRATSMLSCGVPPAPATARSGPPL